MFYNHFQEEIEEFILEKELEDIGKKSELIVFNDDFNTFDWVIKCFIEICEHTYEQAEQSALIVHFKGKATVRTAPMEVLKPMKDALVERGLSAVIDSFD